MCRSLLQLAIAICGKSILENEGVYCLNNVCEAVRRLHDESDFEKLSAAMQMADVNDSGSIAVITNQLSDFIYIPGRCCRQMSHSCFRGDSLQIMRHSFSIGKRPVRNPNRSFRCVVVS